MLNITLFLIVFQLKRNRYLKYMRDSRVPLQRNSEETVTNYYALTNTIVVCYRMDIQYVIDQEVR